MRRALTLMGCCALAACATTRPPPAPTTPWEQRLVDLQSAANWQLDGRAAVAFGSQGWQATLSWRQSGGMAELHLSGPFGVGAMVIKQDDNGLSLNGSPSSDAVLAQVQDKLGFDLPIENLHDWLLGVPDPGASSDFIRNGQGRAQSFSQAGWHVAYEKYIPVGMDLLPARLTLTRADVRVRIIIDHWTWPQ